MEVTNRFKGLDLIDRVLEELWTEICNTAQEMLTKTIPPKRNARRQSSCLKRTFKWLRREAKGKGEKDRYMHLNAELQRIARRDKKTLLSDQCKEIEENNKMGKPRDLFKKIRDTKGTFQAKMGTMKDSGKNTQKNYTKKILMTQMRGWCDHSPRARHPGVQSQVGLRKHHCNQS